MQNITLFFLIFFLFASPANSQTYYTKTGKLEHNIHHFSVNIRLKQYSIEQGLEASYVYDIEQDHLNRLWLATNLGIVIFDNQSFRQPRDRELRIGEITSLEFSGDQMFFIVDEKIVKVHDGFTTKTIKTGKNKPGRIITLFAGSKGEVLAGTDKGIFKVNMESLELEWYPSRADSLIVFSISENSKGIMAAGTSAGLIILNGPSAGRVDHPVLGDARVVSVLYDKNNYLWAGTVGQGLFATIGNTIKSFQPEDGLSHPTIISLEEDRNGNIIAGTYFGFNHLKSPLYKPMAYRPGSDINASSIWCIKRDRQNNLWIGTENGLFTYSPSPFTDITDKNGIVNSFVISAHKDDRNNIWFGTQHGFSSLRGDTFHNYHITHKGQLFKYHSISSDPDGTMYFGTNGLVRMRNNSFDFFGEKEGFTNAPVYAILRVDTGVYLATRGEGLYFFNGEEFSHVPVPGNIISDIILDRFNRLVIGGENGIFFKTGREFRKVQGSDLQKVNALFQSRHGDIYAGTEKGVLIINPRQMNLRGYISGEDHEHVLDFAEDRGIIWAGSTRRIWQIEPSGLSVEYVGLKHGYKGGGISGKSVVKDDEGNIYFGSLRHLARYNRTQNYRQTSKPSVYIQNLQLFNKEVNWSEMPADSLEWEGVRYEGVERWLDVPKHLILPYDVNHITIRFNALSLQEGNEPEIRYRLDGFDSGWTEAPESNEITYLNLSPGEYSFLIEGRLPGEEWSASAAYTFQIVPAFWQTGIFSGGLALVGILGLVFGVKLRTRNLTAKKNLLENLVRNRTFELYEQKVEMEKKSVMLEEKNEEIFKSIRYAKRIQQAIIPPEQVFAFTFKDAFVMYNPKDIVSGDFYWIEKLSKDDVLFSVADCTGHGVPGAFMSIVGYNGLNRAVNEEKAKSPADILKSLTTTVSNTIRHSAEDSSVRDGMDIAICRLQNFSDESGTTSPTLEYSGANSPLWIIRKKSLPAPMEHDSPYLRIRGDLNDFILYEIRPTKQAIGGADYIDQKPFKNHSIQLYNGDQIYLFTDGYGDTFGGPDNRKFKKKSLGILLLKNHHLSMQEQKAVLENTFMQWKGDTEQIDDVCIAGIRV